MRLARAAAVRNSKNAAVVKPAQIKLFCDPLQAMIQMIIIVVSTELERLWKRFYKIRFRILGPKMSDC